MGMKQLEAAILAELRAVTGIPSLRQKDISEWSTGSVKAEEGEAVATLPAMGVNVAYRTPAPKKSSARA